MTTWAYLLGIALLVVVVCSLAEVAAVCRRWLLPTWTGPAAWLAQAVIGIALLIMVGELLGTVGWFKRWPLVLSCLALAVAALIADRAKTGARGPSRSRANRGQPSTVRQPFATVAGLVLILFLLLLPWTYTTLNAIHHGIREYDSLSYHLPFAAHFAQTGSTTGLLYTGNPPVSFYPMNSELIHAVGMLLFGRDIASLGINFLWLALALLASWCIGGTRGVGVATVSATALVLSIRVMAFSQGGTAKNDLMSISLLLAAVALLSQRSKFRAEIAIAALAAGLAVGTRLTLWAPVFALAAIVTATAPGDRRAAVAGSWVLGIIAGCGYWYGRNLVRVGNPVPWLGGSLDGLVKLPTTSPPVDCGTTSVAHYLPRPGFLAAHIEPQLEPFLGQLWWVVVGLAVAGIVGGLLPRSAARERALALVALAAGAAYLFTPASAGGTGAACFGFNTRFFVPALALGVILVPMWLARLRVPQAVAVLAFALVIAIDAHIPLTFTPVLVSALLAGAVGAAAAVSAGVRITPIAARASWSRRTSKTMLAVGVAACGAIAIWGGWEVQRVYFRGRYTQPRLQQPADSVAMVLSHVSDARIAVTGLFETYPLYGVGLSNEVAVPAVRAGARFRADASCRAWLGALAQGHFKFAITAFQGTMLPPAAGWTHRFPGARELQASATTRAGKPWRWEVFLLPQRSTVNTATAC